MLDDSTAMHARVNGLCGAPSSLMSGTVAQWYKEARCNYNIA